MNKPLGKYILPLMLLTSSTAVYAESEIIISRITQITDDHILIDGYDGRQHTQSKMDRRKSSRQSTNTAASDRKSFHGPYKYDLVTESNQHLSPYPLTEFWIDQKKSDHNTFKGIGYTHEAEITVDDGTVRKIRTLDDYIL